MGFWHTGYMEHHEDAGLGDWVFDPTPPTFPCTHCGEIWDSLDDLRKHRFEKHPLKRPILFFDGMEVGAQAIRVTRKIAPNNIAVDNCDRVFLNEREIPITELPNELAEISWDVCKLTLTKTDVSAEYSIEIRVASDADLAGIEKQFEVAARKQQLDTRSIDDFISATSEFNSAIGYCDGICSYLYGVLAKERTGDTTLPYEAYVEKYNNAVNELAGYDRPLARTISSVVEFHFNHFSETRQFAGTGRIGRVSEKYLTWLRGNSKGQSEIFDAVDQKNGIEMLVTDWETEQIVRWADRSFDELGAHAKDIESFLDRDLVEYDRVKLQVLLAEFYNGNKDKDRALVHAKALRNLSGFDLWADAMIRANVEVQHD